MYIIPADDKATARYLVAKTILDELQKYDIAAPEIAEDVLENIHKYRQILKSEDDHLTTSQSST